MQGLQPSGPYDSAAPSPRAEPPWLLFGVLISEPAGSGTHEAPEPPSASCLRCCPCWRSSDRPRLSLPLSLACVQASVLCCVVLFVLCCAVLSGGSCLAAWECAAASKWQLSPSCPLGQVLPACLTARHLHPPCPPATHTLMSSGSLEPTLLWFQASSLDLTSGRARARAVASLMRAMVTAVHAGRQASQTARQAGRQAGAKSASHRVHPSTSTQTDGSQTNRQTNKQAGRGRTTGAGMQLQ